MTNRDSLFEVVNGGDRADYHDYGQNDSANGDFH